jgi:hypothetical protein
MRGSDGGEGHQVAEALRAILGQHRNDDARGYIVRDVGELVEAVRTADDESLVFQPAVEIFEFMIEIVGQGGDSGGRRHVRTQGLPHI